MQNQIIKRLGLGSLLSISMSMSYAQSITYGKIESPKQFQHYWGLTGEQMQTYENYMQIAGKYRHRDSNPLVVLSIIADDDEDKGYFAAKAAAYESQMSQREILSAWLISDEMEKQGLAQAMNDFADGLTGINTADYVPDSLKSQWLPNDALYLLIDKTCLAMDCLSQFDTLLASIPDKVEQTLVIDRNIAGAQDTQDAQDVQALDNATQSQWDKQLSDFQARYPHIKQAKYDRIEHGFLREWLMKEQGQSNRAVQVRDHQPIRIF